VGPSRDLWSVTDALTGETVEAAIIVSVLLSFVEQLMTTGRLATATDTNSNHGNADITDGDRDREYNETNPLLQRDVRAETGPLEGVEAEERMKRLISRMKIQIWAGMGSGLLIATGIGAAFIAIVCSPLQH
jgi:high-affinity iron transporter